MARQLIKAFICIIIFVLASMCLFGCIKSDSKKLGQSDLLGTWYVDIENTDMSISFQEDGTYLSGTLYCDGTYQIADDGTVKVVDAYKNVDTLYPVYIDGELCLYQHAGGCAIKLSQTAPLDDTHTDSIVSGYESLLVNAEVLNLILTEGQWSSYNLSKETELLFEQREITWCGDKLGEYWFDSIKPISNGYTFTLWLAGEKCTGCLTEDPLVSEGTPTVEYRLQIVINGESQMLSRHGTLSPSMGQ